MSQAAGFRRAGQELARRHWLFLSLLAAGAGLRVVTSLAYRPALLNSAEYLASSSDLYPGSVHPAGYPAFLRVLPLGWGLEVVPAVQHLLGLATAVILYALVLRLGVRHWVAALAAAPVLLDAYQLNIEQYLSPEAPFELLLVATCALLLWRRPPSVGSGALAGLLLAAAALTRSIAVLAVIPALLALVFLRARLVTTLVFLAAFAIPLASYATWFHSAHGAFALTGSQGRFLYGRVADFADCRRMSVPLEERALCLTEPVGQRPPVNDLLWGGVFSPFDRLPAPPGPERDALASDFAERVIRHQPGDYASAVVADTFRAFEPVRTTAPGEYGEPPWEFQRAYPTFYQGSICSAGARAELRRSLPEIGERLALNQAAGCAERQKRIAALIGSHGGAPSADPSLTSTVRSYQRFGYVPGPLLAAGLLVGLAAAAGIGRARRSGLRTAAFLFTGLAIAVCLASVAVTIFSWRYQLPQLVLLPPALVLGVTALTAPRRATQEEAPALPTLPGQNASPVPTGRWHVFLRQLRERASASIGRRAGE